MHNRHFGFSLLIAAMVAAYVTPCTFAADKPATGPVRALHYVLRGVTVGDAKRIVDMAKASGFNTIIMTLADAVDLSTFPGKPLKSAWSAQEFASVVHYARQKGMAVIPEVKLATHQQLYFGDKHPELMYNLATYDPRDKAVYDKVFRNLDEIIKLVEPAAVHIGHDEVAGHKPWSRKKLLRPGEQILPAELFYEDVMHIHGYLKNKGIETWMWGDMLISPDEFPGMRPNNLHGDAPGYGKELRRKLPKDIVICDWHYGDEQADFPSLAAFKAEGFRVLGATWKNPKTTRNFSRYAMSHGAEGMIATTWSHVQRKEWDVVEQIIRESGEAFRNVR